MKNAINIVLLITFFTCFAMSCRDNYFPGALSSLITMIIYVRNGITSHRNEFLRNELDRGREILTHLYDKYD